MQNLSLTTGAQFHLKQHQTRAPITPNICASQPSRIQMHDWNGSDVWGTLSDLRIHPPLQTLIPEMPPGWLDGHNSGESCGWRRLDFAQLFHWGTKRCLACLYMTMYFVNTPGSPTFVRLTCYNTANHLDAPSEGSLNIKLPFSRQWVTRSATELIALK